MLDKFFLTCEEGVKLTLLQKQKKKKEKKRKKITTLKNPGLIRVK